MNKRTIIATGALVAVGLGASLAQATPELTSVEVNRTGKSNVEVVVEAARGTGTATPRITATIGGRSVRARAINWARATSPTDTVTYVARFKGKILANNATAAVTVRACDAACDTIRRKVTVVRTTSAATREGSDVTTPLLADAIDSTKAVTIALASVGDGSTLLQVERADELGAAWEVKVLRADGARVKVYVAADGTVAATRVEGIRDGADHRDDRPGDHQPPPRPPGSITSDQAGAVALDVAGPGSTLILIKREDDPGVAYEVKVRRADGARVEVKIAADGRVVSSRVDD